MNGNNGMFECAVLPTSLSLVHAVGGAVVAIENRVAYIGTGEEEDEKNPHVATKSTSCGDRKTSKLYKLSPKTTRHKKCHNDNLNVSKKDEKIGQHTEVPHILRQARLWLVVQFIATMKRKRSVKFSFPIERLDFGSKSNFNSTQPSTTQNQLITIIKSVDCRVLFCSHVFDDCFFFTKLEINFIAQKKVKHVDGS